MIETETSPQPYLPNQLPESRADLSPQAIVTTQTLVSSPKLLEAFTSTWQQQQFLAQEAGDHERQYILTQYLDLIAKRLRKDEFLSGQVPELTLDGARVLLHHVPDSPQRKQVTPLDRIALSLTDIHLNRLPESEVDPHRLDQFPAWQRSLRTQKTFLEAIAADLTAASLHQKWLNLINHRYNDLLGKRFPGFLTATSFAGRASFLALKNPETTPEALRILELAAETDNANALLSYAYHRGQEYQDSARLNLLTLDLQVAALTFIENLSDMTRIINPAKIKQLSNHPDIRTQIAQITLDMVKDPDLPTIPASVREVPLQPESLYLGLMMQRYPHRLDFITDLQDFIIRDDFLNDPELVKYYNAFIKPSQLGDRILTLIDPATRLKFLEEATESMATAIDARVRKFPLTDHGFTGYALLDSTTIPADRPFHDYLAELLKQHDIDHRWRQSGQESPSRVPGVSINTPDGQFLIAKPDFLPDNPWSPYLESRFPPEILQKAFDIRKELAVEKFTLPRQFTRSLAREGYRYDFANHPQIPGLIQTLYLRRNPDFGFTCELKFIDSPEYFLAHTRLSAQLDFSDGTFNIRWQHSGDLLQPKHAWLLEQVITKTFASACCLPISESNPLEQTVNMESREVALTSIPPRLVHVGDYRLSGERKRFTPEAELNYIESLRQTGQLTAAQITDLETALALEPDLKEAVIILTNKFGWGSLLQAATEEHWSQEPGCDRYLTWNIGYDLPNSDPVQKQPPADIF